MNDTSPHAPPPTAKLTLEQIRASRVFFAKVYTRIAERLARYQVPRQERADLAQDIVLAMYEGWSRFDPASGTLDQWLHGILLNHVRRWYARRASAFVQHAEDEEQRDERTEDEAKNTEELLMSAERRHLLDKLLRKLPFEHRAVLIAHDLDGVTFEQIAAIFRRPVSTVYTWYQAANKELRAAFEEWQAEQRASGVLLLPLTIEALLDAGHAEPSPLPDDEIDRAWRRFQEALGGPQGGAPASKPRARQRRRPIDLTSSLPVVAYLLAGQPGGLAMTRPREQPVAHAAIIAEASPSAMPSSAPSLLVPVPVNTAASSATPAVATVAKPADLAPDNAATVDDLAAFDKARSAFDQGDMPAALRALEEHAQKHPRGRHAFDRDRLWLEALVSLGRTTEACRRAKSFRRAYPKSPLPPPVEEACSQRP